MADDSTDAVELLTSVAHVKWTMEVIGHSFSLKLENAKIIEHSLSIYEKWMLINGGSTRGRDLRPKCMLDCEQEFIQDMLGHISFIFDDRSSSSASNYIDDHVTICNRAMDLLLKLGRVRGKQLSQATWERLLRLLIGITDNLLHGTKSTIGPKVCAGLYRVTLELFLRSAIHCGPFSDLWKLLTKFSKRWVHRRRVIEQWNAAVLALTRRAIYSLYGMAEDEETDPVRIVWMDNYTSTFEYVLSCCLTHLIELRRFTDALLSYAWYRTLNVLGHPHHIADPEVHAVAMVRFQLVWQIFRYKSVI